MPKIFDSELRFMQIVWEFAPVGSGELVKLAFERLGIIHALVTREEAQREEGAELLSRSFGGSLPGFVAAFANAKAISREDAEAIRRIIDAYEEGER